MYKAYKLKMADSESIKETVNQAAVQASTVVIIAIKDTDTGPWMAPTPDQHENQRQEMEGWC